MTKKEDELELVEFKLDRDCELKAVSIVKDPAIEKQFMLFKSIDLFRDIKFEKFEASEEKQEITGVVMTPDKPILRYDEQNKKYFNCFFTEETIKDCMAFFLKNCNHTQANFDHSQDTFTNKVSTIECWQVADPTNDKLSALGFTDITKGDWAMTYKVEDKELWNQIKEEGFTGFSIEGMFGMYATKMNEEKIKTKARSIINSSLSNVDKERLLRATLKNI